MSHPVEISAADRVRQVRITWGNSDKTERTVPVVPSARTQVPFMHAPFDPDSPTPRVSRPQAFHASKIVDRREEPEIHRRQ
jgi:hypothetical protein